MFPRVEGFQGNRDMRWQTGSDEHGIGLNGCQGRLKCQETSFCRQVEELLRLLKHPRVQIYTGYQFNISTLLYDMGTPILSPATHPYLHKTNRHRALLLLSFCLSVAHSLQLV
jgi:hypothetical protein